jgi:hypothetical protein
MARLQERSGRYWISFRCNGENDFVTLGKVPKSVVCIGSAQVDGLLPQIKQRLIERHPKQLVAAVGKR